MDLCVQFKCCGVYNHTDWYKITAWPDSNRVPRECCLKNVTCAEENTPADYYEHVPSAAHLILIFLKWSSIKYVTLERGKSALSVITM